VTEPTNEPVQTPPAPPAAPAPPPGAPPVPAGYAAPPPVPPGMYYDAEHGVVLPNGVVLASVGRRIGAYFLSLLLAVVTLFIGWAIWGLIVWAKGTSPAFQVLGCRCWKPATNQVADWGTMALRDGVGRIVESVFFGIGGIVSFIMFLSNRDHRSLSDMIGSTIVVYDPNGVIPS
jgi:uncharacterized RDD family membrane protein YckC